MKSNKALLKSALKSAGFNPEFGDGYLNIARADGVHCEFYGDTDLTLTLINLAEPTMI